MLKAIENLENSELRCQKELDELEMRICSEIQNAAPLLDICNRLRAAKVKLALLKNKIDLYGNADAQLKMMISECLEPTMALLQSSANQHNAQSTNHQNGFNSKHNGTPIRQVQTNYETADEVSHDNMPQERKGRQTTPKHTTSNARSKSPGPQLMYQEVDESELATLDTRSYGQISLNDIRELHQFIWDFFQNPSHKHSILTQKQIQDNFPKIRTLRSTLRFLKTLKRIELTKDGNIKCALG